MLQVSSAYRFPFIHKERIAEFTYSFYFDRKENSFDFLPGQYVQITLPIVPTDGLGASRKFTISSSPLEKEILAITLNEGRSDFKKAFFALKPEMLVQFSYPMGGLVFNDTDTFHHVFLAGGIGITPFRSMILYADSKNLSIPMTLFASFSKVSEVLFYQQLTQGIKNHNTIHAIYTISGEVTPSEWSGKTGRISEALLRMYIHNYSDAVFYVVGPGAMIEQTEEVLETMGIAADKIKVEQFDGY